MNLNEWHEQAGRAAYEAIASDLEPHPDLWDDTSEATRERWRGVARAVLAEGKIEVRPSAELAEAATREENERLIKIARERAEDAQSYRDAADELRSKLAGLRRAYDHACTQRDKYMRRTVEWRSAALDGFDMPEHDAVALLAKVRKIALDDATLSHEHRMQRLVEALGIDDVRACTGCGKCSYCQKEVSNGKT